MKDKGVSILVVALVFFAFLSGSLWTKVRQTEKKAEAMPVVQNEQEIVKEAEEPQVLGAEDQAAITQSATAVKGDEKAKVTIVEFSEYQCPFCKTYVDEAYAKIMAEYGSKVRYIFRDYPLSFHQHAQKTAQAARCAGDQKKYWEFHDLLFKEQEVWSKAENIEEKLMSYAIGLGLNESEFKTCLEAEKHKSTIQADFELGQKVGVQGTPSFFVNGQMLVGAQPFENFKALIDQELSE